MEVVKEHTTMEDLRNAKSIGLELGQHTENLLEIKEACENALNALKKKDFMKAYYELDMASIGVTVAKMRVLNQQQNEKKSN